jgi:hypothetical protein
MDKGVLARHCCSAAGPEMPTALLLDCRLLLLCPAPAVPCPCCLLAAIIKRVLLVILAAVGLGTALFFIGLEYLFPKY